jgi:hypothetical protein
MSLAKNLGGRVGVKENFLKILLQICDNLKRSQKFSAKMAFFSQKSKKFLQKAFFPPPLTPPPPKLMYAWNPTDGSFPPLANRHDSAVCSGVLDQKESRLSLNNQEIINCLGKCFSTFLG